MSSWYKLNPVDWNEGTNSLTLEQEAAYLRICNAIYIAGGPISNNGFVIAGLLRCNDRKAKRIISELVEAGKITVNGGSIYNRRALEVISERSRLAIGRESAGRRGGIESGKSRANPLKNIETGEANASSKTKQIREDKNREERKEEPNGSSKNRGCRLPEDWRPDEVFATGQGLSAEHVRREAEQFRDYWLQQPGQKGVKLDWNAAWRTWIRNEVRRNPPKKLSEDDWRKNDTWAGVDI